MSQRLCDIDSAAVRTSNAKDGGYYAVATVAGAPWRTAVAWHDSESIAGDLALGAMAESAINGTVSASLLRARSPRPGESYSDYLLDHDLLGYGFSFGELVRPSPRHREPPRTLWQNMVPTLAAAYLLRCRMVDRGSAGLRVNAAYRPSGGSRMSRHKVNAALDLDLLPSDVHLGGALLQEGARLWATHQHLRMGAGSYAPKGARWTQRLHIDTGTDKPRPNTWQIHGDRYLGPGALFELAEGMA